MRGHPTDPRAQGARRHQSRSHQASHRQGTQPLDPPAGGRPARRTDPWPRAEDRGPARTAQAAAGERLQEAGARLQISLIQTKINEVEAASHAGWSGHGQAMSASRAWPRSSAVADLVGVADLPLLPLLDEVLFELAYGMHGLGMLRTADRWKRMSTVAHG